MFRNIPARYPTRAKIGFPVKIVFMMSSFELFLPIPSPLRQPFDFAQNRAQDRLSQKGNEPKRVNLLDMEFVLLIAFSDKVMSSYTEKNSA